MSIFKTLSKGYKGDPSQPKVKSNKKLKSKPPNKVIDSREISNQIKKWYSEGRITSEGLHHITLDLQNLCGNQISLNQENLSSLEKKLTHLNDLILKRQSELNNVKKEENIVDTIKVLTDFFGEKTIQKIKEQNNVG